MKVDNLIQPAAHEAGVSGQEAGLLIGSFLENLSESLTHSSGGSGAATASSGSSGGIQSLGLPSEGAPSEGWLSALARQCRGYKGTSGENRNPSGGGQGSHTGLS